MYASSELVSAMDTYEATRMVYSRLQAIDPDHASKVMGYLLLQDEGDQELLRLAFSHDAVLQALVLKVKKELGLPSRNPNLMQATAVQHFSSSSFNHAPPSMPPISSVTVGSEHFNSNSSFLAEQDDRLPMHQSDLPFFNGADVHTPLRFNNRFGFQDLQIPTLDRFSDHLRGDMQLGDHLSFVNDSHEHPYFTPDYLQPDPYNLINSKLSSESYQSRFNPRRFSTSDLPMSPDSFGSSGAAWKPCLYFARGFCKHGSNCKFLHTHMRSDAGFLLSPNNGQHDSGSDDGILAGTLERLELELQELLRGRKAPISIASLPQLYYERFGKTLQADGYLTESQRHGKAGYSLTKLLARLKNSVTLIDRRPHGQHAVVLAEDAVKFNGYRGEKEELNPGSRQIYLTFPADSAFTEEDVSSYFRVYGPVQDVRIPFQQKRMFGFVTFVYPETVKMILAKGNPHFICGARVLVKPYKEKGKHADRKFPDRDYLRFMTGQALEPRAFDSISGPRFFMEHDALRKQLEDQEMIMEMERKRFAELHLQQQRRQHLQMQQEPASLLSERGTSPPSIVVSAPASQQAILVEPLQQPSNGNDKLPEEDTGSSEDVVELKPIQTSSAFDVLVDSLESNEKVESTEPNEEGSDKQQQSDEHNLPDSPFTSPHKPFSPPPLEIPTKSLATGPRAGPPGFGIPSPRASSLNCRICKDFYNDPVQLDCGHALCVQCILKVIRVSKEECPICQRHMGSQIVKLMEARRLQIADIW